MKKNIEITINKAHGIKVYNNRETLDLSENNAVAELITKVKEFVPAELKTNVVKEELFYGTQLMKLDETVPAKNGIELVITIK